MHLKAEVESYAKDPLGWFAKQRALVKTVLAAGLVLTTVGLVRNLVEGDRFTYVVLGVLAVEFAVCLALTRWKRRRSGPRGV